jgi:hypothetical protein
MNFLDWILCTKSGIKEDNRQCAVGRGKKEKKMVIRV